MGSRRSRASVLCGQSSHECDDWGTLLPCDFLSIRSYHIGSLLDLPSCHAHHAPAAPSVPHRVRSRRTACELHARGRRAAPDPKRDQPADPAARGIPRPLAVRARASFAAADDRWRAIRSAGAPSPHAMRGSHARCDEALRRSRTDDRVLVRCGVAVAHATPARVSRQLSGHQAAADRARRAASMSPAEFDVGVYYVRQQAPAEYTARRLFDEEVFPVCAPGSWPAARSPRPISRTRRCCASRTGSVSGCRGPNGSTRTTSTDRRHGRRTSPSTRIRRSCR